MLKNEKIEIKTTNKNITYYKKIQPNIFSGDIILINPEDLPETSKIKVKVFCDVCGIEREISMFSYRRNINKYNFYSCPKCSNKKSKKTCLKKYGIDSFTKTDEYKEKTKKTKYEKYGNEKYINKELIQKTCLEKYGKKSYMSTKEFKEKSKETMNKKYNVDKPLQSNIILNKMKKTNNKLYGCDFVLQNLEIQEKIKKTKYKKYKDKYYNNREKYKETNILKFGFDNPMKNEVIKEKLINIMYDKYGVYYPAQLKIFYEKMLKNGYLVKKYKDLYYQGSYEKDFLDKYYNIGIKRGPTIKYFFNNTEHLYYSDFYYKKLNLIIEIKSTKWYNEHLEKNLSKQENCIKQGYNFLFIIDKDYTIFNKIIKQNIYNKSHCWQYDLRLNLLSEDLKYLKNENIDIDKINIKDFDFKYVDKNNTIMTKQIKSFIEKYEWLGKMPNRPTHRFIATYKGILSGVVIMATPNNFSKFVGENTKDIEKLISRGACASWTPKNLASKLIMWSIKWMSKNTKFSIFSAYSDTEAKEIGTIYQACNFYYIGQKFGSIKLYFDLKNPNIGWATGRNFRKKSFYKKIAKENNIQWRDDWLKNYTILWENIPLQIKDLLINESNKRLNNCLIRKTEKKHKYVYILGKNKKETKKLRKIFLERNKTYNYKKRIY
jgi:hypothetical protein